MKNAVVGFQVVVGLDASGAVAALEIPVGPAAQDLTADAWASDRAAGDRDDPPLSFECLAELESRGERCVALVDELEARHAGVFG